MATYTYQSWKGETVETDQCIYCLATDGSHEDDCEQANPFIGPLLTNLEPCADPKCMTTTLGHFEWCQNVERQAIDNALSGRPDPTGEATQEAGAQTQRERDMLDGVLHGGDAVGDQGYWLNGQFIEVE